MKSKVFDVVLSSTHVELTHKEIEDQKLNITAVALVSAVNGRVKTLVLMMGGIRLPGESRLTALAGALRRNSSNAG